MYQKHVVNSCGIKYDCIYEKYSKPIKIINNANSEKVLEGRTSAGPEG